MKHKKTNLKDEKASFVVAVKLDQFMHRQDAAADPFRIVPFLGPGSERSSVMDQMMHTPALDLPMDALLARGRKARSKELRHLLGRLLPRLRSAPLGRELAEI